MKKITPHLWFDKEAREAAEFYTSSIPNSKITNISTLHNTPSGDCDIARSSSLGSRSWQSAPDRSSSSTHPFRFM